MDVNGENMARKWLKETRVHGLIIAAQWQLAAQFANKYVIFTTIHRAEIQFWVQSAKFLFFRYEFVGSTLRWG